MANDGFALSHQAKHSATVAIGRLFRFLSFVPDSRPTSNPVQAEVAADGERLLLDLGLGLDLSLLELGLGVGLDLGRNRLLGVRRRRARRQLYFHFFSARNV